MGKKVLKSRKRTDGSFAKISSFSSFSNSSHFWSKLVVHGAIMWPQCCQNCAFRVSRNVFRKKYFFRKNVLPMFFFDSDIIKCKLLLKKDGCVKFYFYVSRGKFWGTSSRKSHHFSYSFRNLSQNFWIHRYNFPTGLFKSDFTCFPCQVDLFHIFFLFFSWSVLQVF